MDTLYTFWDNITHYKTKSVDFLLMNSATKSCLCRFSASHWRSGFQGGQVYAFRSLGESGSWETIGGARKGQGARIVGV